MTRADEAFLIDVLVGPRQLACALLVKCFAARGVATRDHISFGAELVTRQASLHPSFTGVADEGPGGHRSQPQAVQVKRAKAAAFATEQAPALLAYAATRLILAVFFLAVFLALLFRRSNRQSLCLGIAAGKGR